MTEIERIKPQIASISKAHNLKLVILYGSTAKGTNNKKSDIDIALLGQNSIGPDELIDISDELAEAFSVKEMDAKSLHGTDPFFRYQVMRDGKLLFGDNRNYLSFRAYAFRDYIDSKDLRDLKEKIIKKRLKKLK